MTPRWPTRPRRATAERSRGSRTPEQLPPARPLKDRVGHAGEVAALAYLKEQGFRILARDWRSRLGQIDIVAEDGDTLVLIEVKARRGTGFGTPEEAVDERKPFLAHTHPSKRQILGEILEVGRPVVGRKIPPSKFSQA